MHLTKRGANRDHGPSTVFNKSATAAWNDFDQTLMVEVRRAPTTTLDGSLIEHNYRLDLSIEEVGLLLNELSKQCERREIAQGLRPHLRALIRLQAAAVGLKLG